jgi:hypothetical protein
MLRRIERESKAKAKEQQQSASTSTLAPPPVQPPPIQTAYGDQTQHAPVPATAAPSAPQSLDILTSEHPHSASLHSGSSGVGSTPTQIYEMPFHVTYPSSDARQQTERDSLGESTPDADDAIYPARVVDKETKRHSFFRTILNPTDAPESAIDPGERPKNEIERAQLTLSPSRPIVLDPNVQDPITVGLLDEQEAKVLFDLYVPTWLSIYCCFSHRFVIGSLCV